MRNQFSLRTRLLVGVGALAVLALAVVDVSVYTSLRSYLYEQADSTLQLSSFSVEIAADSNSSQGASNFCAVGRESAPGMFIEVRRNNDEVVAGEECPAFLPGMKSYSPTLPLAITGFVSVSADPYVPVTYFTVSSTTAGGPAFRVEASKLSSGAVLIVADPLTALSSTLRHLVLLEASVSAAALLGVVLLGLWIVRLGLRPLRDVVRTAESISGGDLMHRVPNENARTEVGHVALALNIMLERIQSSFRDLQLSENRLRQFVSDASHELRTPLAAVSAYAQLFKQGAAEREEDLPRIMEGIERETRRMAGLVEDLLLLARIDERSALNIGPVELSGLAAESVETARTVGPEWPVDFVAEGSVEVMGDWNSLRQVMDNLLANVRAHTPQGTPTTVRVGANQKEAYIEVADRGPGFSEEEASKVFERFFRADPSRSRETGGAGLGLAIVATIVHSLGGRAIATPRPGGGAMFRIVLPALDSDSSPEE
jgi:two-component system, OmpR family, sensor kinase